MSLQAAAPPLRSLALRSQEDVVKLRQLVREFTLRLGFSLVEQTKVITAASELARNTVLHGGGGTGSVEALERGGRQGLRLSFVDQGPGIADLDEALRDGYTTGAGLGLGLGGARRLSDDFELDSTPGRGTRVSIVKWKR